MALGHSATVRYELGADLGHHVTRPHRRRVLIVVSAYAPAIVADMHRARMLAWELPRLGWDVEVLTPRASEVRQDVIEPEPKGFFAPDTPVHEVGSSARGLFEALGSRTHSWRTWWTMRRRGDELLRARCFDLVYFTTTTFLYFSLGPRWTRLFNLPFVLDFHDPWLREGPSGRTGGDWRARLARQLSERMERAAVTKAAGMVSVSPQYIETLRGRYAADRPAWLAPARNMVSPFGILEQDLSEAAGASTQPAARPEGELTIHYVGAGGEIMARSFGLICRALAELRARKHSLVERVRIKLFGTVYGWSAGDPKPLEAIARDHGVGDLVSEMPERVSYRRSLELLLECDGALILGVNDAGYMPSKLFGYGWSGKPLLAALRRDGPALAAFQMIPELGHALWFDGHAEIPAPDAAEAMAKFLTEAASRKTIDRRTALQPYLASAMAHRHAQLFDACLAVEQRTR